MIRTPTTSLHCFCRNQRGYRKATIKAGWIFDNLQVFKLLGILFWSSFTNDQLFITSHDMSGQPPCQNRNTGCRRSGTSDFHGIHGKQGERMDFEPGSFVQQVSKKVPQLQLTLVISRDLMWYPQQLTTSVTYSTSMDSSSIPTPETKTSAVAKRTGGCKW